MNCDPLDRFAYTLNNPVKYTDPSGHDPDGSPNDPFEANASYEWLQQQYLSSNAYKYLTFDQFVMGYQSYQFYYANPDIAFLHSWNEPDAYLYARLYSEYHLHTFFLPFGDAGYIQGAAEARESGDILQRYADK